MSAEVRKHLESLAAEQLAELLDSCVVPRVLATAFLRVNRIETGECAQIDALGDPSPLDTCAPGTSTRLCAAMALVGEEFAICCGVHACVGSEIVLDKSRHPLGEPPPPEQLLPSPAQLRPTLQLHMLRSRGQWTASLDGLPGGAVHHAPAVMSLIREWARARLNNAGVRWEESQPQQLVDATLPDIAGTSPVLTVTPRGGNGLFTAILTGLRCGPLRPASPVPLDLIEQWARLRLEQNDVAWEGSQPQRAIRMVPR